MTLRFYQNSVEVDISGVQGLTKGKLDRAIALARNKIDEIRKEEHWKLRREAARMATADTEEQTNA